jgi:TolA-binding protein
MGDVRMYMSEEVPLSELRRRYVSAVEELQFRQQYLLANDLARDLTPLIGRTRQLEVLARVLQSWGTHLIASSEDDWQKQGLAAQGRAKLRESGAAFEQLAQRRFATPHYIDDLWQACENYFWGHSYSSSTRVLGDYLRYEPEKRNAQALLRLGQSQLARGNTQRGITALEECIELHPDDAATYQARLDCAAGYRNLGDDKQAEDYLLANLAGSLQSPRSPEWRDSLFALGHLLHDTGRFTEAIDRLEEAIDRYPTDKKSRLARYLVADSYRQAADAPLAELKLAQTENEREKASREATRLLSEAINRYEQVQRDIALGSDPNELDRAMLRNCYMMRADALFDLQRYEEASKAYSNVSTLYQSEPFVLETLIQIANCQRRLNEPLKAQLTVEQAKLALERLPPDADYTTATNFTREQWRLILDDMGRWKR